MKKSTMFLLIIGLFLLVLCLLVSTMNSDMTIIYRNLYLICYFSIFVLYILKENKQMISIKSLYALMYTLMFGLSPLFYILNNNSYTIQGKSIVYQYPIAIMGLVILMISYYIPFFKNKNNSENDIDDIQRLKYNYAISILLIIISTIINVIYIYKNKSFLFSSSLESSRIEAMSGNGLLIMFSSLNLIGTSLLFDYYMKTNKKKIPLILSIIVFSIIYIIRGFRTPILRLFIIMVLIYNCYKKIKLKHLLFLIIISLTILSWLLVVRTSASGGSITFLTSLLSNLQTGSINYNYIFNTFPNNVPFQHGYGFLVNIKMMLPGSDPDFTLWLKDLIGLSFAGGGITPTLFGEGYLNFGVIGGFIEIFIIGLLGRKYDQSYLLNDKKTFWTIYLSIVMLDVFRGGFANVEITLITTLMVYVVYSLLYNNKKVYT